MTDAVRDSGTYRVVHGRPKPGSETKYHASGKGEDYPLDRRLLRDEPILAILSRALFHVFSLKEKDPKEIVKGYNYKNNAKY
ncbi:MAG: hypothetical protein JRF59_16180 [Deltaproteobacteria bacterium]|nr:hypothetical protein [Deltaproteobacteria bacterium]MBW1923672.1 hypothetical protein [Deltaproteobacteria bacterium]MBW1950186.1 hypothetical protein [Deltaproteobacteria bacterium]MBW2103413.1 hypothetical protein [Deltaproteobacteria bacterium]MBW2349347.1 hypothetical protein [Deltaproteobacteria bacterium]